MDREQIIKVAKGAALAAAGAIVAYLAEVVLPGIQDSGSGLTLTIAAMASVGLNAARKWLTTRE
jgi:hypothetical protein